MTVITPIFFMQLRVHLIILSSSCLINLIQSLSLSLQLTATTIINGSIIFEPPYPFCFFLFILLCPRYTKWFYIQRYLDAFMCNTFYRFYFYFVCIYVIVQTVHVYKCMNRKKKHHPRFHDSGRIIRKNSFTYMRKNKSNRYLHRPHQCSFNQAFGLGNTQFEQDCTP